MKIVGVTTNQLLGQLQQSHVITLHTHAMTANVADLSKSKIVWELMEGFSSTSPATVRELGKGDLRHPLEFYWLLCQNYWHMSISDKKPDANTDYLLKAFTLFLRNRTIFSQCKWKLSTFCQGSFRWSLLRVYFGGVIPHSCPGKSAIDFPSHIESSGKGNLFRFYLFPLMGVKPA